MQHKPRIVWEWQLTPFQTVQQAIGSGTQLDDNTLFVITGGRADWQVNRRVCHLERGSLLAVEAYCPIESISPDSPAFQGYKLTYDLLNLSALQQPGEEALRVQWKAPSGYGFSTALLDQTDLCQVEAQLSELKDWQPERDIFLQAAGSTLLVQLYNEQNIQEKQPAIERAMTHIKQHYRSTLTREQLANQAGMSPWHFSRKFKEQSGYSPMDYLLRYRMNRAQEHLLQGMRVQEASRLSGFDDVFYFSKRFKATVGITPARFAEHAADRRIAAGLPRIAEALLALDIIPCCVLAYPPLIAEHQQRLFDQYKVPVIPVPQYALPAGALLPYRPQWIITQRIPESDRDRLRDIAPTLSVVDIDSRHFIADLAPLLGRQTQADAWRQSYDHYLMSARRRLAPHLDARATALIIRVEGHGYRYMNSKSHISPASLLYDELALRMPVGLADASNWCSTLDIARLAEADPNYVFIENRVFEGGSSDAYMQRLLEDPRWLGLKAVRHKRVFPITTRTWITGCGAFGYQQVVDQMVDYLIQSESGNELS
ncbi:helix-turn-helix domain-containing protein [Paenibacillus sp. IB182496]|uniref:Helix-turn-helix domain-containing protein n=1 Tax=Paenibacillus sabuli TaxID=2772509 RepID=A0A927BRF2_9BACL|nr:helix-turn-helix domain-containing protein [Paenibacillus sabuli]MBD2844385.1 helix-turn-helix domain-containing protein [Paenibacillus sabuli]